jgi:2-dehydropantoate 2-reductase
MARDDKIQRWGGAMDICIVGAGAIGGLVGVELVRAGENVTLISRGANLEATRRDGVRLIRSDGREEVVRPARATDRLAEAGVQDVVILAMKAHQVAAVVADVPGLLGPDSVVVTMQNGVPWWYFHGLAGPYEGMRIEAVDPGGTIAAHLDVGRVIGSVVYPAAELIAPAVIRHIEGNRFSLGELDGAETPRVKRISELFRNAGFKAPVTSDIRSEIWLKIWGNACFNPISALTHATLVDICRFPATRAVAAEVMREVQTIGEKLGAHFRVPIERRIAGAEGVGAHKTSTLQDLEHGRALELDALVGAVVELGRITQTATPHLDTLYACASLLAKTLSDQRGRLRIEPVA